MRGQLKKALHALDDADVIDSAKLTRRELKRLVDLCKRWARLAETEIRHRMR